MHPGSLCTSLNFWICQSCTESTSNLAHLDIEAMAKSKGCVVLNDGNELAECLATSAAMPTSPDPAFVPV